MNCWRFRRAIENPPFDERTRAHAASCADCRAFEQVVFARRALLEATRCSIEIDDPAAGFYYALNLRLQQDSDRGTDFWLPTILVARSVLTAAMVVLVLMTGVNLYLTRESVSPVAGMDSYWRDTTGDGEAIVLSDDALTPAEVLSSLVAMRGQDGP